MKSLKRRSVAAIGAALALAGALVGTATASPVRDARAGQPCSTETREGWTRCMSVFLAGAGEGARGVPKGYGPSDLRAAYKVPAVGARSTVAVVIAFDVPHAEKDLGVYRSTFGLPSCTTANGCFRKVNQSGQPGNYPAPDGGWAVEGSMDLQLVSAACPTCKIILVEANDNSFDALAEASRTAARLGATVISHSYGGNEWRGMFPLRDAYEIPGTISVASSGDWGFTAPSSPAVFRKVLAVGGTTLRKKAGSARGWDENVWNGSGSGCSAYIAKSSWQRDPNCTMRTTADVSAVADPETGVAVYDSYPNPFGLPTGWLVGGGTSASAPYVAGLIGLKGTGATFTNRMPYAKPGAFFDTIGGDNGTCGGDYLCKGLKGYDAPTGVGSPNGLSGL